LRSSTYRLDHYLVSRTRREPLPDLSHVLDDTTTGREPVVRAIAVLPVTGEKRIHNRFDKVFPVMIGSELYGDGYAIARNVSAGGILVEMSYAPPLGTIVTVHFQHARGDDLMDEIVARAEVKHHHYLNFGTAAADGEQASSRAIGMRFIEFIDVGEPVRKENMH
jgi:hypothetical protein